MRKIGLLIVLALGIIIVLSCTSTPKTLVLLHSNDTHGTFHPQRIRVDGKMRLIGGMQAASHYINKIRSVEPNLLLIDSGDLMTGTLASRIEYQGVPGGAMPEFLNRLGYDIRCHGSHAFDMGFETAIQLEELAQCPVIMANLVYKDTGKLFSSAPYHIFDKNGLKVGVVAVMEESFPEEVTKENIQALEVLPIIPTLNSYMPELDKQTDLIIVLVHADFPDGEKVAREVPGVDVALVASNEGRFAEINGVLVKSTIGRQKTLGRLKLEVKNDRIVSYAEDLVWLWADVELQPSREVSELVEEVEGNIKKEFFRVIGKSDVDYLCKNYESIESALGNWITDVIREKTGAQVALQNSGGIRADINAGPVSRRDIFALSPFRNTLVKFKMTGLQLKNAMEMDIERGRDRLQISGMKYTYYPKHTKPRGERVNYLMIAGDVVVKNGKLLLPDNIYSVVSNDYVVGQAKDKYFGFAIVDPIDTEIALSMVLMEWLEKNKSLTCTLQDRIVEIKSE